MIATDFYRHGCTDKWEHRFSQIRQISNFSHLRNYAPRSQCSLAQDYHRYCMHRARVARWCGIFYEYSGSLMIELTAEYAKNALRSLVLWNTDDAD